MDTLITIPVRFIKGSIILRIILNTICVNTESLSWLSPGMSSVRRAQQTSHGWTPSPPHTWRSHWTPQAGLGSSLKMHNGWTIVTNYKKHISFGSKSCVAYCNISHDLHRLNIFNVEVLNMVVCVIRYFIIYFQNPTINITLNSANSKEAWKLILFLTLPYHERFIIVYGGAFKQFSMWKLWSIAKHSPSPNDIMF